MFKTEGAIKEMKCAGCPRQIQEKVLAVANSLGYRPSMAVINIDHARQDARHFTRSKMQAYESYFVQ